jgi:aminoglycoside 6'-N-acetyltransferase
MHLPVLRSQRLTLRPLSAADVEALAAVVAAPGVREWWSADEDPQRTRDGLRNDGAAFAVEVDGALAGWLAFDEETDPDYRHVGLDIVLAPDYQDRGLGSEALRTAIHWFVRERGHHRFTIDPALRNERAIRAYAAVGFRRVGVLRRYERGEGDRWHDNLLMDLLAEELVDEPRSKANAEAAG